MATTSQIIAGNNYPAPDDAHRSFVLMSPEITVVGHVAADVISVIPVKAGMVIEKVTSEVVEVNSVGSAAFGIGDGDGTTSYDAAVSGTAAVGTRAESVSGTDAYALAGKKYAVDDTIDMILSTQASAPTTGKFKFYAHGYWAI